MLKLCVPVSDETAAAPSGPASSYRFDRRRGTRRPAQGEPMAIFSDADGRHLIARVELLDSSDSGLGFLCPLAVEPGMGVALNTAGPGRPRFVGLIARCERQGQAYRIGVLGSSIRAA
ncbi:MAG: hypothetical protein IT436_02845 [Phycisphaerales bacterium]|nr:hypothetical protein [Phycisphaerales bacterium]